MSMLLSSGKIGTLEIGNRFARSATGESACAEGRIPDEMVEYYERLAGGGVGLIITGHAYVSDAGRCHETMTGAHRDDLIPGLRRLADAVHAGPPGAVSDDGTRPARIVLQINHRGLNPPADVNDLNGEEIEAVVSAFAAAAGRTKAAGFDGVQVHAAHGYLLSQFSAPTVNERQDEWGGMVVAAAAVRAVRATVGAGYPGLVKMNCDGLESESLTPEESVAAALSLVQSGADAIEVSGADAARQGVGTSEEEAYFAPYARRIRQETGVPVILVGGMRSWQRMEAALSAGEADFVSLCRPFIREPELIERLHAEVEAGNPNPVADCQSCGLCWSSATTLNRCGAIDPKPEA